ncbi:unnamed protein product [Thelazia callipaeda]|uniref:RRM domain-containing protein n=1 Tax=Thelazia callipaeda TaxID=103827 RepID=A0A0N5CQM7_THECL|nr:unnamed protein product [Thelazia callipaeda]
MVYQKQWRIVQPFMASSNSRQDARHKNHSPIPSTPKELDLSSVFVGEMEDRTFNVQNVPLAWNKWKLFHIFRQFGRVDSIRFMKEDQNSPPLLVFVSMMSIDDASSVINSLTDHDCKINIPELSKPLKVSLIKRRKFENFQVKQQAVFTKETRKPISLGLNLMDLNDSRESIFYDDRIHRHNYLTCGKSTKVKIIKPISNSQWPLKFYVLADVNVYETHDSVVSSNEFDGYLTACFHNSNEVSYALVLNNRSSTRKKSKTFLKTSGRVFFSHFIGHNFFYLIIAVKFAYIQKNELLIAPPRIKDGIPLRCRVLEVLPGYKVRIYALDSGETMVVQVNKLRVINKFLASIPARAIPCMLFGISQPTPMYTRIATQLLETFTYLQVLVVSFDGASHLVRVLPLDVIPMYEVGQLLADKGVCSFEWSSRRKVYSRQKIISVRKINRSLPIPNRKVPKSISLKPEERTC